MVPELLRTGNFNNKSKLEDRESGNRALEIQVVKPFEKPSSLSVQKKHSSTMAFDWKTDSFVTSGKSKLDNQAENVPPSQLEAFSF